jgi:hypothetical protein
MEMNRIFALVVLIGGGCLVAGGCATERHSYAPDGRKAYSLNCSGLARGWDKCFSAAGNICGKSGYDVLDRTGESAEMASAGGGGGGWGASAVKTNERSMLVACKTS